MAMLDDMDDKAKDIMNDPVQRAKVEKIAKDKGISMDSATEHFMKHGDQS